MRNPRYDRVACPCAAPSPSRDGTALCLYDKLDTSRLTAGGRWKARPHFHRSCSGLDSTPQVTTHPDLARRESTSLPTRPCFPAPDTPPSLLPLDSRCGSYLRIISRSPTPQAATPTSANRKRVTHRIPNTLARPSKSSHNQIRDTSYKLHQSALCLFKQHTSSNQPLN